MPIVEITGPELPQESKDRIAKTLTEIHDADETQRNTHDAHEYADVVQ